MIKYLVSTSYRKKIEKFITLKMAFFLRSRKDKMSFNPSYLMLSAGNALLGHVAPSLRAFMVDFNEQEKTIYSYFIYDEEIDDLLFDLSSCTVAEIEAGREYKDEYYYRESIVCVKYPQKIPFKGNLIYLKYEPNLEGQYPNIRFSQFLTKTNYLYAPLFLDMQNALLAKVTPALREVTATIKSEEKIIELYFFYDGPISEQDYQLAHLAARGGNVSFPDFSVRTVIERVDFPRRVTSKAERCVYARHEDMSLLVDP